MDYSLMVSFILLLREHKAEAIRLINTIQNLDEAFRRIYEGAVVIRTNGEAVTLISRGVRGVRSGGFE
ncbi:NBS-LRR resistance-like protein [Tanacetum coccineum]